MQVITLCVAWIGEQLCRCKELQRRPRGTNCATQPPWLSASRGRFVLGERSPERLCKDVLWQRESEASTPTRREVGFEDKEFKIRCRGMKSRTLGTKAYSRVTNLADG